MPRLKICGINDAAFAIEAARRGVDYLGLIFADGSPRRVTEERACEIIAAVRQTGKSPRFVGVFANHSAAEIMRIAGAVPIDVIQLHGNYSKDDILQIKALNTEIWQLFLGSDPISIDPILFADAVLLDGRDDTRSGGTGKCADWSLVAPLKQAGRRVVLAGGISAENIAAAIATDADVIDVNSSLETSPGRKSITLLDNLLSAVSPYLRITT